MTDYFEEHPEEKDLILQAVARGWTHEKNEHKEMDADLTVAIGNEVRELYEQQYQEIERLTTALEYYADEDIYYGVIMVFDDRGKRAREALERDT